MFFKKISQNKKAFSTISIVFTIVFIFIALFFQIQRIKAVNEIDSLEKNNFFRISDFLVDQGYKEIKEAYWLDENKNILEDVYEKVNRFDGVYQEIPEGNYLRVIFKEELGKEDDLVIKAQAEENVVVRVYEKDKHEPLMIFENISGYKKNRLLLEMLPENYYQDTFDLLSVKGTVSYDLVYDADDCVYTSDCASGYHCVLHPAMYEYMCMDQSSYPCYGDYDPDPQGDPMWTCPEGETCNVDEVCVPPCECTSGVCCDGCFYKSSSTVCRAAANSCDVAENCTGSSATCPTDQKKANFTSCGTCKYCVNGSCYNVSTAHTPGDMDPNNDCGITGCLTGNCGDDTGSCAYYTSGQRNCGAGYYCNASGVCTACPCTSGDCCDGCFYKSSGTVCRAAANSCDVAESCTGSSASCPADQKQVNGTSCGTCKYCQEGSCVNIQAGTDPNGECSIGSWSCSGDCQRVRNSGNCGGTGACGVNDETGNIASGYVCSGGNQVLASTSNYCLLWNDCDDGDCLAYKYYNSCNGTGSCRASGDSTGAATVEVKAATGYSLTSTCGTTGTSYCNSTDHCFNGDRYDGWFCSNTPGTCSVPANKIGCCDDENCSTGQVCVLEDMNSFAHCAYEYDCRDKESLAMGTMSPEFGAGSGTPCGDRAFYPSNYSSGNLCFRFDCYDSDGHNNTAGITINQDNSTWVAGQNPASGNDVWAYNYYVDIPDTSSNFIQMEIREWETRIKGMFGYLITEQGVASGNSTGCCPNATDCVYNSIWGNSVQNYGCYTHGTELDVNNDGNLDYCNSGTWVDCDNDGHCGTGKYCSNNVVTNTNLDTGWSKGYQTNIVFNGIAPPPGITSQVVGHDRGNSSGYWYSYGDYAPQVPGETYTVSLYVKTLDSNFRIRFYTANNTETGRIYSSYITVPNDDKWHRVVWNSFTNPSNSQSDSLSFNFTYAGAIGDPNTRTWFCAPQMEPQSHATAFNDSLKNQCVTCECTSGVCCDGCFYKSSDTVCRAADGSGCDVADYCTGGSATCPTDEKKPNDTSCGTCKHCQTGSCVNITAGIDPNGDCAVGSWSCSGDCQRVRNSGNCSGAGACGVNDETGNITSGYVCSGGNEISVSTSNYCLLWNDCDDGACAGYKYYNSCNGSGSCRASGDTTDAVEVQVLADIDHTLTSSCGTTGTSYCDGTDHCSGDYRYDGRKCNLAGGCTRSVDKIGCCTHLGCNTDATPFCQYYNNGDENAKYSPTGDSHVQSNPVQLAQKYRCAPAKYLDRGIEAVSWDLGSLNTYYSRTQTYSGDANWWQFAGDGMVTAETSYTTADTDLCFVYNYDPCSLSATSDIVARNADGTHYDLGNITYGLGITSGCSTNWIWRDLSSYLGSSNGLFQVALFAGDSDYIREWQFGWKKSCVFGGGSCSGTTNSWCCDDATDCVYDAPAQGNRVSGDPDNTSSGCYNHGSRVDVDGDGDTDHCNAGTWQEGCLNNDHCNTDGCGKGVCNSQGNCDFYTDGLQHNCATGYACHSTGDCVKKETLSCDYNDEAYCEDSTGVLCGTKALGEVCCVSNTYACFIGETMIKNSLGAEIMIKDLKEGEIIQGYDLKENKVKDTQITHIFEHEKQDYFIIKFKDKSILKVTKEHPLYTTQGYVKVEDLSPGQKVGKINNKNQLEFIEISKIRKSLFKKKVYNLEVDQEHNYFANNFLVHNKETACQEAPAGSGIKRVVPCGFCEVYVDGSCVPAPAGANPGGEMLCSLEGCGKGTCNGAGACDFYTDGLQHNCADGFRCSSSGKCEVDPAANTVFAKWGETRLYLKSGDLIITEPMYADFGLGESAVFGTENGRVVLQGDLALTRAVIGSARTYLIWGSGESSENDGLVFDGGKLILAGGAALRAGSRITSVPSTHNDYNKRACLCVLRDEDVDSYYLGATGFLPETKFSGPCSEVTCGVNYADQDIYRVTNPYIWEYSSRTAPAETCENDEDCAYGFNRGFCVHGECKVCDSYCDGNTRYYKGYVNEFGDCTYASEEVCAVSEKCLGVGCIQRTGICYTSQNTGISCEPWSGGQGCPSVCEHNPTLTCASSANCIGFIKYCTNKSYLPCDFNQDCWEPGYCGNGYTRCYTNDDCLLAKACSNTGKNCYSSSECEQMGYCSGGGSGECTQSSDCVSAGDCCKSDNPGDCECYSCCTLLSGCSVGYSCFNSEQGTCQGYSQGTCDPTTCLGANTLGECLLQEEQCIPSSCMETTPSE